MARTSLIKGQTIHIPDDSREHPSKPALWGVHKGECEETGVWYCSYCGITWVANFPRWDRILERDHYIKDVGNRNWPCPGCVEKTLVLIEEKKYGNSNKVDGVR